MPTQTRQAVYFILLAAALGALLVAFYFVQKARDNPADASIDFDTIRARLDGVEDNINLRTVMQLIDNAQKASYDGDFPKSAVVKLDNAVAGATNDGMISDSEMLSIANVLAQQTLGKTVRTREDVRVLLSQ